jgi:hypothetical protein
MIANIKFKSGSHGVYYRNSFLVSLLLVSLVSSLFVFALTVGAEDPVIEHAVLVGTETELRDAVKNSVGPIVIVLTKDIQLTGTALSISDGKTVTLTSLGVSKGVF